MNEQNKSEKKKSVIWIALIILALGFFVGVIFWASPKNKNVELSKKEIDRIILSIEQGKYEAKNHVQGLEEINEEQKEAFIYDLDRLLQHLETDFHREAETSNRITRLKQIERSLDFSFCGSEPSIMVTMAGDSEQKTISFREYSDLTKINPNLRFYLLSASTQKTQKNSLCIDKIHVYAR